VSCVYFHSQHGTAKLRGSERAHLGALVSDLTTGFLRRAYSRQVDQLLTLIRPGHYLHEIDHAASGWLHPWLDSFATALATGIQSELLVWNGRPIDPFAVCLNTAMRYGSDPVRLAARIHGQCEIHCYVEGINRAWLANLVEQGLEDRVYRDGIWYVDRVCEGHPAAQPDRKWCDQGWGEVMKLLRDRDDEPVVMSYSVCDGFPNQEIAGWQDTQMPEGWVPEWVRGDEERVLEWETDYSTAQERQECYRDCTSGGWGELSQSEQWELGIAGLRASSGGLEISPDEFGKYYFSPGLTLPDLLAPDYAERLHQALVPDVESTP